jgi:hypothetical protein
MFGLLALIPGLMSGLLTWLNKKTDADLEKFNTAIGGDVQLNVAELRYKVEVARMAADMRNGDAAIVLTLTRWHYDDIAGRLIDMMKEGKGLPWEILVLPAVPEVKWAEREDGTKEIILNEDGTVPGDPLRRKPKEPLAPNRFSYNALMDRAEVLGERSFSALYQQKPMADDGGMFRAEWVEPPTELPPRRVRVRAWDLAASADGDWTVGVLMSKDADGVFYIENVIRFRGSPLDVEKKIFETARNDGRSVSIFIPQDPGQAGKSQAQGFIRRLAGYIVKSRLRPRRFLPGPARAEPRLRQRQTRPPARRAGLLQLASAAPSRLSTTSSRSHRTRAGSSSAPPLEHSPVQSRQVMPARLTAALSLMAARRSSRQPLASKWLSRSRLLSRQTLDLSSFASCAESPQENSGSIPKQPSRKKDGIKCPSGSTLFTGSKARSTSTKRQLDSTSLAASMSTKRGLWL